MGGTVAQRLADHLAPVGDREDDVVDAVGGQQLDLVVGERATGHGQQRLRPVGGVGQHAGAEAPGEHEDLHRHQPRVVTVLPSWSIVKRTSVSPAVLIASRRRRTSLA